MLSTACIITMSYIKLIAVCIIVLIIIVMLAVIYLNACLSVHGMNVIVINSQWVNSIQYSLVKLVKH